jgi:hypothetical protein
MRAAASALAKPVVELVPVMWATGAVKIRAVLPIPIPVACTERDNSTNLE